MNNTQELNEFLNVLHESDGHYQGEEMNLIELSEQIHDMNVKAGWWDSPRPFKTIAILAHSELSEMMEGDRKDLMDDHLPKRKMIWVELADFNIRNLDWLGYVKHKDFDYYVDLTLKDAASHADFICDMHSQVSSFVRLMEDPYYKNQSDPHDQIAFSVVASFEYAKRHGIDLLEIILEKVEYNKHRADHKKENREKPGGKKY